MSKIRVYELAKELGLENRVVLGLCDTLGIEGKKSHSSTLSDSEAEKIRRSVIRDAVSTEGGLVRQIERDGAIMTERRQGNVIIRKKREPGAEGEGQGEPTKQIDLNDLPPPSMTFGSLTPDLGKERDDRQAALARANALFHEKPKHPVAVAEVAEVEVEVEVEVAPEEPVAAPIVEAPPPPVDESSVVRVQTTSDGRESVIRRDPGQRVFIREARAKTEEAVAEVGEDKSSEASAAAAASAAAEGVENLRVLRQRHDIRAPKVLGRLELPVKAEPVRREAPKRGGDVSPAYVEPEALGGKTARPVKRKVGGAAAAPTEDESLFKKHRKKKQIIRTDDLVDYDNERDAWRGRKDRKGGRRRDGSDGDTSSSAAPTGREIKKLVKVDGEISVGELAKGLGVKSVEVIGHLMNLGIMANVNQLVDFDTAGLIAAEFGSAVVNTGRDEEGIISELKAEDDPSKLVLRPPVVTVMGHVDHGKTSLLDAIRKTSVAKGEAGGITQHIGAYNVPLATGGSVTFLDTPGHEAFTAMRSRGAKITDIVVLVVAADDGIMPQTIEAINHAKAAEVPIIVAVNKIDKEGANLERIRTQLTEHGLVSEDWGGDTIIVPVSAHTRQGLDLLLENLYAQAEILELRGNPDRAAYGTVVESRLDKGRGPLFTVLIRNGTLKKGDIFLCGATSGKVRALVSGEGKQLSEAGPGMPVEVVGAGVTPQAGDDFVVFPSESEAREIAEERASKLRTRESMPALFSGPLTLESLNARVSQSGMKEYAVIVKGDVHGSVEAIAETLGPLANDEARVKLVHRGVGAITENDVQLASASSALLIGFNVRAEPRAAQLAEQLGVHILYSRIIYELIDTVKLALQGLLAPQMKESALGRVEVRETFKVPRHGLIAGAYVLDGTIQRGALVRLLRDNRVIHEGKMGSLRRFKEDVKEVQAGYECGIGIDGYQDIRAGDIIEVYKIEEVARTGLPA
ncbi:MAG: translation initiation factor IF-2 [Deltaproteobacteria bacterium]|nr:translation initiation factor IF-2 [Deltaproteobacteria bacterium]